MKAARGILCKELTSASVGVYLEPSPSDRVSSQREMQSQAETVEARRRELARRLGALVRAPKTDRIFWASLGLATLITAALNVPYYIQHKLHGVFGSILAITGSWVSAFSFILLLSTSRLSVVTVVPFFVLACGAGAYFLHEFGVYVNENTLGLVYETNLGEASDLLSGKLLVYLLLSLGVSFFYGRLAFRYWSQSSIAPRLTFALTLFIVHLSVAMMTRTVEVYDPPLGIVTNSYVYFRENARMAALLESRKDISEGAELDESSDEELVVVFVIGETVRPDHLHINGYPRPTTPEMERHGYVSFDDVSACATITRFAVPCMLTRGTRTDMRRPYEETSIISLFRRLGFSTMWASMQGKFWEAIVPTEYTVAATAAIAREAKRVEYLNPTGDVTKVQHFDTALLDYVDAELKNGSPKKMMVLHTAGAHFHYASHYPSRHEHYQPVCKKNRPGQCETQSLNNAYDNAIHFVDEFLGKLADRLKDRRAIVFYVSDHGESLGEGGQFLHHLDSTEPEQNRVAMLAWASEKFKASRAPEWHNLVQNRQRKIGHEHAFHSILDCAGVTSPVIDPSLSVCSEVRERANQLPPSRLSIQF